MQPKVQRAHEQEKTKQTQKTAGQENRLQAGWNKRREEERRAFLPAVLCDALARRLASGACKPKRSTPMNRKKPSKRKTQPVKRTGCKQAGTSGGRGAKGVPSRGFMRCVGAAVSGRSLQPKARRAHEQRKTKQMKKQPVKRTGCKQAGTSGGRGAKGVPSRRFMRCIGAAVSRLAGARLPSRSLGEAASPAYPALWAEARDEYQIAPLTLRFNVLCSLIF